MRVEQRTRELAPRQRIAEQERAPLSRAHRTRLRQHRDDRHEQPDHLPEPRGHQCRGLPARGVVRPASAPTHTHPDDLPVVARSGREAAQASPANRSRWSGAAATRTAAGSGSRASPPTCSTIPSVGAIVTNYRDITERLEHESRLGEQMQRLALMSRITRAIGERQDLRSIFQVVVAQHRRRAAGGFLRHRPVRHGREPAHRELRRRAHRSRWRAPLDMSEGTIVPIDENGLARCVQGQLVYEPDIARLAVSVSDSASPSAGMRSLVIAPLLVESQVFGVLVTRAAHRRDAFSSGECEFLRQASEHTALAAHQAQLYDALQQAYDDLRDLATTDHAAGAPARARPDGERHRARHQQRHLAGGAVHRGAARARTFADPTRALATRNHPARGRRHRADRGAHGRVLPAARAAARRWCPWISTSSSARWSISRARAGATWRSSAAPPSRCAPSSPPTCRRCPRSRARFATRWSTWSSTRSMPCPRAGRSPSARASRPASRVADRAARGAGHGRGHGRGHAPALSRAVLHHQGHARHRPGARDGLWRRPATRRQPRNRERTRQGHAGAHEHSRSRRPQPAVDERPPAAARRPDAHPHHRRRSAAAEIAARHAGESTATKSPARTAARRASKPSSSRTRKADRFPW